MGVPDYDKNARQCLDIFPSKNFRKEEASMGRGDSVGSKVGHLRERNELRVDQS